MRVCKGNRENFTCDVVLWDLHSSVVTWHGILSSFAALEKEILQGSLLQARRSEQATSGFDLSIVVHYRRLQQGKQVIVGYFDLQGMDPD